MTCSSKSPSAMAYLRAACKTRSSKTFSVSVLATGALNGSMDGGSGARLHLLEPQAWREHEMLGVGATAQFKSSECQADSPFISVPLPGSFWGLSTNPKRRTDSFCALGHFILHSSFLKEKKIQPVTTAGD